MKNPKIFLYPIMLCVAALALNGCNTASDGPVQYDGATLIVNGVSYERVKSNAWEYGKGRILVTADDGKKSVVTQMARDFGLNASPSEFDETIIVDVPEKFELQWMEAFYKQANVKLTATVDPTEGRP